MQITVSIDHTYNTQKPTDDVRYITKRLIRAKGTVEELAKDLVLPIGKTFAPAVFSVNGKRTNDLWESQQVFALDFDNGLSFDTFISRAKEYDILPAFVYSTFSSVDNNKFRAVYVLPFVVTDFRLRQVIQLALMRLYPESDGSGKDAARIFYGGKELFYENYTARLDVMTLIEAMVLHTYAIDKSNAPRTIRTFCEHTGLDMVNDMPHITALDTDDTESEDLSTSTLSIYRVLVPESSKTIVFYFNGEATDKHSRSSNKKYTVTNTNVDRDVLRNPDWKEVKATCPVYQDFMQGIDVHHSVTWFVASNLIFLEGGETRFFEGLRKRSDYNESKWRATINYIKKTYQHPANYSYVSDWYPNVEEVTSARNLVAIAKKERGKIKMINQYINEIDLEEAEQRLQQAFNQALEMQLGTITLIRAPTAIGKTKLYENISEATIAVPTHKLKNEIADRMQNAGNTVYVSPELPDVDQQIIETMDNFYNMGAVHTANRFIRSEAKSNPDLAEYVELKDFTTRLKGVNVIVSHARLPYLQTTNDTIIIDEDILPTLLQQDTASMKDIIYLRELLKPVTLSKVKSPLEFALDTLINAPNRVVLPMPKLVLSKKEITQLEDKIKGKLISSNVLSLLNAKFFIRDFDENTKEDTIYYISQRSLPNKRVIVLSATASEFIYKRMFGDRLHFIDIGSVKSRGKIKQITGINTSRDALRQKPENKLVIKKLLDQLSIPTITYAEFEKDFGAVNHFGALAGLDSLAGKDIAVIGTPNFNVKRYLLVATALGIDITMRDYQPLTYVKVRRNGFEFYFMTYSQNADLQEVQLHLIESELQQAIGRARHLRNNVVVFVFSNLPIPGAEIHYYDPQQVQQLLQAA